MDRKGRAVRARARNAVQPRTALSSSARRGDLIIDVSHGASTSSTSSSVGPRATRCSTVNASLESWDPSAEMHHKAQMDKFALLAISRSSCRHREVARPVETAVVDHGANPGLVSHFVKAGLLDIGATVLRENKLSTRVEDASSGWSRTRRSRSSRANSTSRVIHCSERDTPAARISRRTPMNPSRPGAPRECGQESISPAELGWGTAR